MRGGAAAARDMRMTKSAKHTQLTSLQKTTQRQKQVENLLPPIRGSQPEVIWSWCAHHHHHPQKVFAGRLNARSTRTRLPRRAGGARPRPARPRREPLLGLDAAATPLARRQCAVGHHAGAPLEHGRGGGSDFLAVCHPTLALGRSLKHALRRASRAARSARRLRHPPPPRDNARKLTGGEQNAGARARSAHAFGAERVARDLGGSCLLAQL